MSICKHCNQEFEKNKIANHTKWCDKNPKLDEYTKALVEARKKRNKQPGTNQYIKAKQENREIESPLKGRPNLTWKGRSHSEKTKQILREKALASPHRRLKKGTVLYKGILLDSSWELELAKRLDEINVKWVRPDPIPWVDNEGTTHNYFPDFYLEDYDLFLDPKNPAARKVQKKKLQHLLTQYNNIVILKTLEECKEYTPV